MESEERWTRVDRLVEKMSVSSILAHKVGPLAARRWRELGRELPIALAQEERAARLSPRLAVPVLARAREAYRGRMLLLKGPELAARYPPGGRHFHDLDLLVDDARAAQDALLAAGFAEVPDPEGRFAAPHHLPALAWPGVPLKVELHSGPKWPGELRPPKKDDLFGAAVESRVPVGGLEAPAPRHHALLVAGHAWAHAPLRSLRDLIDVAVLANEAGRGELNATAAEWGASRIWQTTADTLQWLLEDGKAPTAVRLWARHLLDLREPTVVEGHTRRWLAPFWMLPPAGGARLAMRNISADFLPDGDEPWRRKVQRILRTAKASRSHSEQRWQEGDEERWF
jgi:hypothetical protein